jgi:hypothetical protein
MVLGCGPHRPAQRSDPSRYEGPSRLLAIPPASKVMRMGSHGPGFCPIWPRACSL